MTHRAPFAPGLVPDAVLDHLVAEAAHEGALVRVTGPQERIRIDQLSTKAVDVLGQDLELQKEVAAWARTQIQPADGISGAAHGLTALQAWLEPTLLRHRLSRTAVREDQRFAAETGPSLLVLGSPDDHRPSLLRAGAGMQRLLLRATASGLHASFRNAALHVPELRQELGRAVGLDHPQIALRLGLVEVA